MDKKWIWILVILVFCQKMTAGAGELSKEGQSIEINCKPVDMGTMVIWFRVLDTSGMEFIASFSNTGLLKSPRASFSSIFSDAKSQHDILTLKAFNKIRDSGVYSCASLKGNELKFGKATRLIGEKVEVEAPQAATTSSSTPTPTPEQSLCTTAAPCACNNNKKQGDTSPELFCAPIILGPLAGGCGLLLLLLIVTTLYCNQMRTRRCPHHYKRRPQMGAPGKQKMTNRHV